MSAVWMMIRRTSCPARSTGSLWTVHPTAASTDGNRSVRSDGVPGARRQLRIFSPIRRRSVYSGSRDGCNEKEHPLSDGRSARHRRRRRSIGDGGGMTSRRAKIVCTLGPASRTAERIGALIDEGMDVARLNFSHGDHEVHAQTFRTVRAESERRGRPVGVLQDLQGPKIRVGRFAGGAVELEAGADFTLTTDEVLGDANRASTTYEALPRDVKPGDTILLDDGMIQLEVDRVEGREVQTRVVVGGRLSDHKGLNLPGVEVSAPALTDKDRIDLKFGLELGVDFVALSFVRSPEDVLEARRLAVTPDGRRVPVIAKIERPEAVARLDEIIDASEGIMVARGDLGVEMGNEKVPLLQKRCIEATNARGKLVIVATQMLESMIVSPRPTRAEA